MKKLCLSFAIIAALCSCTNDDVYEMTDFVGRDTISIDFQGNTAAVSGQANFVEVSVTGADVVIDSHTSKHLVLRLSGTSTDGSLLVYGNKKYTILLDGLQLANADGPAINNQCGKSLYVVTLAGTDNTITDGTTYTERTDIDQKGALFSEGQIYFRGNGTLNINGLSKNAVASDDYVVFEEGTVNIISTANHGVKAKDSVVVSGGVLNIDISADGAKGIRSNGPVLINGGTTTITTTGNACVKSNSDDDADSDSISSCAGIKCDSIFCMTAGMLTISSSGDGGKGINSPQDILFKGGSLVVTATGTEELSKPKGVKSDTRIVLSGGYFDAYSRKSKACDNAGNDEPEIVGTPTEATIEKRHIVVRF